jgi:hypothetical protein
MLRVEHDQNACLPDGTGCTKMMYYPKDVEARVISDGRATGGTLLLQLTEEIQLQVGKGSRSEPTFAAIVKTPDEPKGVSVPLVPVILAFPAAASGPGDAAVAAGASGPLLFSCLLNRSVVLNVYREGVSGNESIRFETRHFLGTSSTALVMHHPRIVQFSNVLMALEDAGQGGYVFLRLEIGNKPSGDDLGDSTVYLDVNLPQGATERLSPQGKLTRLPHCSKARSQVE